MTNDYIPLDVLYMQNITEGKVRFQHIGSANPPKYRLVVTPEFSSYSISSKPDIDFTGHPPSLANNNLKINQGVTVNVTNTELSVDDQDSSPSSIFFTISDLKYGYFAITNANNTLVKNVTGFS